MAVLGMRGTGTFADDERPKNWRQAIMLLFPNGDAPLTAILSMLAEESTDDPEYRWFEKGLPVQRGMIRGAEAAADGTVADNVSIAAGGASDGEFDIKVRPDGAAADDHSWLKPGHLLYNQVSEEVFLVIRKWPTAGVITIRRDVGNKFPGATNPAITGSTTVGDTVVIVGSGFPEGAPVGESIAYAPLRHSNFTEIFRTALSLTRTARKTRLRYDKQGPYTEAKREALQIHGIEMERAFMFGEREEIIALTNAVTGEPLIGVSAGRPLRTTRGLLNWLPAISTTTVTVHTDIGTLNGGGLTEALFDAFMEEVFRHGSSEKLAFVGGTALNVLNQLAKNKMVIQAVPTDQTYGMALNRLISPFGTLLLKQHPLLSTDPVWRKDMFIVDMAHLKYRYLDDTRFLRNRQSPGDDASTDEFLTEAGLEAHFTGKTSDSAGGLAAATSPPAHGRLKGVASYAG